MATKKRNRRKPVLALTMGDFNGTAPEVILKSIVTQVVQRICTPVIIGSIDVFEYYARRYRMKLLFSEVTAFPLKQENGIPIVRIQPFVKPQITPGTISSEAGSFSGLAIKEAVRLCLSDAADGIVTGPVSKDAMHQGGFKVPGQTEMLLEHSRSKRVAMMLVAGKFRVGLATVHFPLKDVSRNLTRKKIVEKLSIIDNTLKKDFNIKSPRIAALGLNPHAGERGILGTEEQTTIIPALKDARRRNIHVEGPFPADAFFGMHSFVHYDAVLAMYHDQGLIPLKIKGFDIGVNVSAGLSIVRTSPDHGTAFDIAGKGIANPSSMIEAIKLAVTIIHNRRKHA